MGNAINFPEPPSIIWDHENYYIENTLNPVPPPKSKDEGQEKAPVPANTMHSSLSSLSSANISVSAGFRSHFTGGSVFTLANENFTKHLAVKIYMKYYSIEVFNWLLLRRQLLSKLSGAPYIVPIEKAYQDEDRCYILMPFFPGGDLAHYLDNGFAFTYKIARSAIATIVVALQHLHVHGIVHEDVRPENVFIDAGGACHLSLSKSSLWLLNTSFPIPKLVLDYTSPEVLRGERPTPASDWWSFGAMLAHMVQGHPPFEAPNMKLLKRQIFSSEPTLDYSVPTALRALLASLLAKDPAMRLSSAAKVIRHPFFAKVDWDAVRSHAYESLFQPTQEGYDMLPARNADGELDLEAPPERLEQAKQEVFARWDWNPKRKQQKLQHEGHAGGARTIEDDHALLANAGQLATDGCPLESTVDGVGRVIFSLEELPVGKSFQTLQGNKLTRTDDHTCVLYVPRKKDTRFEIFFSPSHAGPASPAPLPTSSSAAVLATPTSSSSSSSSPTSSSSTPSSPTSSSNLNSASTTMTSLPSSSES